MVPHLWRYRDNPNSGASIGGSMRYHEKLDWPCPLCKGEVEMQACATVCLKCGVSLDPKTHKPFKTRDGKIVYASTFGGGQIP